MTQLGRLPYSNATVTTKLEKLSNKYQLKQLEDWYNVQDKDLSADIATLLVRGYPEHNWQVWRLARVPRGYWEEYDNRKACFDWLGPQLGITELQVRIYVEIQHQIEISNNNFRGSCEIFCTIL